jgi:mannosyltransferase OCH1-like enzyme
MKKKWHMMYVFIVCCSVILLSIACSRKKEHDMKAKYVIQEVDFDTSMGKGTLEWQQAFINPDDVERYNILRTLYENNKPSRVAYSETAKIPKIIHQIWVGPKNPPPHFVMFRDKWLKLHPDW